MAYRKPLYKSQNVEVNICEDESMCDWRKAKIVSAKPKKSILNPGYHVVRFLDGYYGTFSEECIRPLEESHNDRESLSQLQPVTKPIALKTLNISHIPNQRKEKHK